MSSLFLALLFLVSVNGEDGSAAELCESHFSLLQSSLQTGGHDLSRNADVSQLLDSVQINGFKEAASLSALDSMLERTAGSVAQPQNGNACNQALDAVVLLCSPPAFTGTWGAAGLCGTACLGAYKTKINVCNNGVVLQSEKVNPFTLVCPVASTTTSTTTPKPTITCNQALDAVAKLCNPPAFTGTWDAAGLCGTACLEADKTKINVCNGGVVFNSEKVNPFTLVCPVASTTTSTTTPKPTIACNQALDAVVLLCNPPAFTGTWDAAGLCGTACLGAYKTKINICDNGVVYNSEKVNPFTLVCPLASTTTATTTPKPTTKSTTTTSTTTPKPTTSTTTPKPTTKSTTTTTTTTPKPTTSTTTPKPTTTSTTTKSTTTPKPTTSTTTPKPTTTSTTKSTTTPKPTTSTTTPKPTTQSTTTTSTTTDRCSTAPKWSKDSLTNSNVRSKPAPFQVTFQVTGTAPSANYKLYGGANSVYIDSADLGVAAVQAGLLEPGQTGILLVNVLKTVPGKELMGDDQNGIKSYSIIVAAGQHAIFLTDCF